MTYRDEGGPLAGKWRDGTRGPLQFGEPAEVLRDGWGDYFGEGH